MNATHRDTIFVEEAHILEQTVFPGPQFVTRLEAPEIAKAAKPGTFAHLTCDPALPMRRPLSIMRAAPTEGWIEFLYKLAGEGLRFLGGSHRGDTINVLGPIGKPFVVHPDRPRVLMLGGGVGIPPMVFLAESLQYDRRTDWNPVVFMGSELPFPFEVATAQLALAGMPPEASSTMPLMEELGVPCRLASEAGYEGAGKGFVTDLARAWLKTLDASELSKVEMFSCGPTRMLKAAAKLAREFDVPCQAALEEFMACAVGGCAGCTVLVDTPDGPAMKRVCVDGPVFDASTVHYLQ